MDEGICPIVEAAKLLGDKWTLIILRNLMGGPSRLRFHGVTRILSGTAPEGLGPGRFNLTFRQW